MYCITILGGMQCRAFNFMEKSIKLKKDLRRILSIADEHGLPVMFHSDQGECSRPLKLAKLAREFPSIRFNFAHCRPMGEMATKVMADSPNVWTDTAYMALHEFPKLSDYDWHGRLMFGTDLPVWQAHEDCGLTSRYRAYVEAFRAAGLERSADAVFRGFVAEAKGCGSKRF